MKQTLSFIKRHYQSLIFLIASIYSGNYGSAGVSFVLFLRELECGSLQELNTTLEENLSHWHKRYKDIHHEIIGKYE